MKISARAKSPQLQERDAFESKADDRSLFRVAGTFVPQTAIGLQQLCIFFGETIETGTAKTILALDNETQGHRQFSKRFLVGFDGGESRNQVPFAVRRTTRIQLSLFDSCCEWTIRPLSKMAHRLHVVVTV